MAAMDGAQAAAWAARPAYTHNTARTEEAYLYAMEHPLVVQWMPCYCGCGSQGHSANESCFVARRDARGNVLEWDTHGFGCTICVDVAREAMQLYSSGADVVSMPSSAATARSRAPASSSPNAPTKATRAPLRAAATA